VTLCLKGEKEKLKTERNPSEEWGGRGEDGVLGDETKKSIE